MIVAITVVLLLLFFSLCFGQTIIARIKFSIEEKEMKKKQEENEKRQEARNKGHKTALQD